MAPNNTPQLPAPLVIQESRRAAMLRTRTATAIHLNGPIRAGAWTRRVILASMFGVLAMATSAMAQLPAIPAAAGTGSVDAVAGPVAGQLTGQTALEGVDAIAVPDVPFALEQDVSTAAGTTQLRASQDGLAACADLGASAYALPVAAPVALPVAVPVSGAAADTCLEAGTDGLGLDADARTDALDVHTEAKANGFQQFMAALASLFDWF